MRRYLLQIFVKSLTLLLCFSIQSAVCDEPDFSEGATIGKSRENPYGLNEAELHREIRAGRIHALNYPVSNTGILVPWHATTHFFDDKSSQNPLWAFLKSILRFQSRFQSTDDLFKWLGLHRYPKTEGEGAYFVPWKNSYRPKRRMGVTFMNRKGVTGFTFSCAACHSSNLFGRPVLGLTNRFPRANYLFSDAVNTIPFIHPSVYRSATDASFAEEDLFAELRNHVLSIGTRRPQSLGLDTSLSHVAMSLSKRRNNSWADYSDWNKIFPRSNGLSHQPADSKPAVWWNVKYKNRWLSDGSVISGNPILTNILWNEIGRGADLRNLSDWIDDNKDTIEELTTAVFSAKAPRYTDFFDPTTLDIDRAKHGQSLFENHCSKCHGTYQKNWDKSDAEEMSLAETLETYRVIYHKKTPVINVGTDSSRRIGMQFLAPLLNRLEISKINGVRAQAQKGYVPPPLVGIWARWPYFHNNSAPNLCAVLTAGAKRPKSYYSGEAIDQNLDFDSECVGYPIGDSTPSQWKTSEFYYDTRKPGLGNSGHDERIFLKDGNELFSPADKLDIIEFLKTL